MKRIRWFTLVVIAPVVVGCAAMFVPATSDPIEKLNWASELFDNQDRPLPAERLIREAIEICEQENNIPCLGKANVTYGLFFRSPSIGHWEKVYRGYGFYDKDATLDNRMVKSKEYLERGIACYLQTEQYDALTNAYLNLGFTYYFLKDKEDECQSYAKTHVYYAKSVKSHPDAHVSIPPGVGSLDEYVDLQQRRAGCL